MKILPKKSNSGQALLIVLLTMAVVLTVVLSVVSRSITDISVTTYEEEAQRAFDAAEAGVERVLLKGEPAKDSFGQASYEAGISEEGPSGNQFVYPTGLDSGESVTFWFVSHDKDGNLICDIPNGKKCLNATSIEFCWGKDENEPAALEITVYYDLTRQASLANNYASVKVKRYAYDSHEASHGNNFTPAEVTNCTIAGENFVYSTNNPTFPIKLNAAPPLGLGASCVTSGCVLMVKVRALYNSSPISIGFSGGGTLPSQGETIESVGSAGESTRKVEVFRGYSEIPFIFDAAVFSPGGIEKSP